MQQIYTPGRWHCPSDPAATAHALMRRYSTPRAWYRKSQHWGSASGQDAELYANERYVTAAAVFASRSVPRGLLTEAKWALIVYPPMTQQAVVIVSVQDPAQCLGQVPAVWITKQWPRTLDRAITPVLRLPLGLVSVDK